LFDSGSVISSASSQIYAGKALTSSLHAYWKVRVHDQAGLISAWSEPSEFTVGLLSAPDWGAQWISAAAVLPIFRHEFAVTKPVTRALLSVCGLGQYEVRVNGANVSDAVMEPSWTNYAKTCHYATYDATKAIVQGQNAIGVLLGNGMYNVLASNRYAKFTGSFGKPKLILRLQLDFGDGTSAAIVSDSNWKTSAGPITFSNIYGGEDFDANLEPAGWDKPGFIDTTWAAAQLVTGSAPNLVARFAPPVKVQQSFTPTLISQPTPGVFVYDLGQNFSGWPEIAVQGAAGKTLKLTPGELLNGGLVTQSNVGSPVYFSYTLKGGGVETWHPRFSYTGFRYVQVEGGVPAAQAQAFPDRPLINRLTGQFIYASAENVGKFSSSDADLNRIHQLILAAIRSNLQNVLTDCPQREKLGWLETAHLLAPSIMFDFGVASFYEKIVDDMADAQLSTGLVTDIAPEYPVFAGNFRDSPEWGSSFLIAPWHLYQMYGDSNALNEHYADMKRYEAYLRGKSSQNLLGYGLGDWYDVGPAAPGVSQNTSAGVTATALWLQDLQILQSSAELFGKTADAAQFQASQALIAAAFNAKFLKSGSYDRGSQTALAMPLVLGLVPPDQRSQLETKLATVVSSAGYRVTAGDIGFSYLLRALTEAERGDVIYALLKQATGPGYLYQLDHGATALTEAWDANIGSSQNHAMLGHAEAWLYSGLGGINPDPSAPGFAKIVIRPQPQPGLGSVDVEYHSIRGSIKSSWVKASAGLSLNVSIPVNTSATVYIPTSTPGTVTEGGIPAASAPGVVSHSEEANALVLVVGSGQYEFVAP
jgi:alpha-L-rhamnosidase